MAELSRLAVLIDGDNTQPAIAAALLDEIARYGVASVKRVYGDWTTSNLNGWKKMMVEHALQPIQQFAYTTGKNATDGAMIIDAMDLLYTQNFDGFCLVSSDSDFTGLAKRIRQNGLTVYGFGERKTPQSLVASCDRFVFLDVLRGARGTRGPKTTAEAAGAAADAKSRPSRRKRKPASEETEPEAVPDSKLDAELRQLLLEAVDDAGDDDGWAGLGAVGSLIAKRKPEFDSRNYGYKKLSDLVIDAGLFETDERKSGDGKQRTLFLRGRRRT